MTGTWCKSIASVDRRRRRPLILNASCRHLSINVGAVPWRQRYASTHKRIWFFPEPSTRIDLPEVKWYGAVECDTDRIHDTWYLFLSYNLYFTSWLRTILLTFYAVAFCLLLINEYKVKNEVRKKKFFESELVCWKTLCYVRFRVLKVMPRVRSTDKSMLRSMNSSNSVNCVSILRYFVVLVN